MCLDSLSGYQVWFPTLATDKLGIIILYARHFIREKMANIATLTSKRGGNRGSVTKLINKLSDIIADATMERDRKIHELNKKR